MSISVFVSSVALYSILRYFDVWSTKLCLAKLDPEIHEINPIVARLVKKIGFNKTMLVTWVLFAILTGLIDALYVYPIVGIPVLWLLFGLFHLIAFANNLQVHFQVKIFGAEVVEQNTKRIIRILKRLSILEKVLFLIRTNFLNLFFAIYGVVALVLFTVLLRAMDVTIRYSIPILLLVGPPIMILDLIMFFPTIVFGSLLIALRRLRSSNEKFSYPQNQKYLTVSVECLEDALREAQLNSVDYVQFLIPSDD